MMMSDTVKHFRVPASWRVELPNDLYDAWGIATGALLGILMWIVIIAGVAALI